MKRILTHLTIITLGCLVFFGAIQSLHAQEPAAAPAAAGAAPEAKKEKDKSFMDVVKEGGIMMIPLFATSVALMTLIIDGFIRLRNSKLAPPELVEQVRAQFRAGDYAGAYQTCKARPTFFTNIVKGGLNMVGHGRGITEKAIEDSSFREASALATRVRYMSVIGVVTPMLGLTGTVSGMIRAFATIGSSGIGDPSSLAAAIGEVLVATFTGLAVAIPGFAFYYFFGNRITATTAYVEEVVSSLFRAMPYDQLVGIEVGDEPSYAGPPQPSLLAQRAGHTTATVHDTIQCPTCHNPVTVGSPACPNCNTVLNWAA